MQRADEIHVYRGFSSILGNRCCFLSFQEKRLSYPSYAGASVTAEIMSVHFQSRRERRKEKERKRRGGGRKRERAHSRDNGRGGVVGMRTRMGMGGR